MYAGLLSALDAGDPEPLLNELMRFGFVRETMNMTQPLNTSWAPFGCVDAARCELPPTSSGAVATAARPAASCSSTLAGARRSPRRSRRTS